MIKKIFFFILISTQFVHSSVRKFHIGNSVQYEICDEVIKGRPIKYYIAKIDFKRNSVSVTTQLAKNFILGKEKVSDIAKREMAAVAINGAFYSNDGDPLGLIILENRIVSVPILKRAAFGITKDKKIIFGNPDLKGYVTLKNDQKIKIDGINQARLRNQVVLFTPEFGYSTRTSFYGQEIAVLNNRIISFNTCNSIIPPNGFVVAYHGDKIELFNHIEIFSEAVIDISLDEPWNNVEYAIGGGPWLVRNGEKYITSSEERFQNDVIAKRAPRTAVGITKDEKLIFIVVDGRKQGWSEGCDLEECADILLKNNAYNAINMDGGGSSTFCINGNTINKPSDGVEREVSNVILVKIERGDY